MSARSSISESHVIQAADISPSPSPLQHTTFSPEKQLSPHTSALSSPNASRSSSRTAPEVDSSIVRQQDLTTVDAMDEEDIDLDNDDNGSSSLSELEADDVSDNGSDDAHSVVAAETNSLANVDDVDSEAETEHLEKTPRKPSIIQHDGIAVERSPSKLSKVLNRDELDMEIAELSSVVEEKFDDSPLSITATVLNPTKAAKHNLGKRKRSSSVDGASSEIADEEPLSKRNHMIDDHLQLQLLNAEEEAIEDVAASQTGDRNDADPVPEEEEPDVNEAVDEPANGTIDEEEHVAPKVRSGRRGRRKGRRDALAHDDALAETSDTPAQDADEPAEVDEEEEVAREEELAKRKLAAEALSKIERDFLAFREKHLQEQLEQIDGEISLLRVTDNCVHPDYLARLVCLDHRRDDKIQYENTLLRYNLQALVTRTIVERGQYLSQYHQEVRAIRDVAINNCYRELFNLQKDRRRYGVEESSLMLFTTSKADQARGQAAYGMELSLLSGISANIGFPAAPSMSKLSETELQQDLIVMEINQQPVTNVIRAPSFQDRTTAGDQFLERTPWANPQHPAHANGPVNNFHTQVSNGGFATPAPQRQYPVTTNINGSASTIEMLSNPPSSAAGPPQTHNHIPIEAPTPLPTNRKESGRVYTTYDASTNAQFPDSNRAKAMAQDSSPDYTRLQHPQHAYPSPSRMNNATVSIGMVTHGEFGPVPQRTAMAPVMSSSGTLGA